MFVSLMSFYKENMYAYLSFICWKNLAQFSYNELQFQN